MSFALALSVLGLALISLVLSATALNRLPVSRAMLYLAAGYALGPAGVGWITLSPLQHSWALERATEGTVLISLFGVGLKLGLPLSNPAWRQPLRLALISMAASIALLSVVAVWLLELSWGAAILLAAILAPTDPVLASEVQLREASDRDRLRFGLSGEGGLNDGAAFPFVMLGLGLLGLHELGHGSWRWWSLDLLWPIGGGLCIGAELGWVSGKMVVYLRSRHLESLGNDAFLALGLIALSYGCALLCQTYGFLAVLAAGMSLRRVMQARPSAQGTAEATPAAAAMMQQVEYFIGQIESFAELIMVLIIGSLLAHIRFASAELALVLVCLLLVRPLAVWLGLLRAPVSRDQRWLISWFGIRGVGSVYYLMFALNHGVQGVFAQTLISVTLALVALSITAWHLGNAADGLVRAAQSRGRAAPARHTPVREGHRTNRPL